MHYKNYSSDSVLAITTKDGNTNTSYFLDGLENNTYLHGTYNRIIKAADRKNEKPPFINKGLDKHLETIEKLYGNEGLTKGLPLEKGREFMRAIARLYADSGLSLNQHRNIAHMLPGYNTEPGYVGAMLGLFLNGNQVTEDVSPFTNKLEERTGEMIKEMFGYEGEAARKAASFITIGGTEANHLAMLLGRNWSYLQTEGINIQKEGMTSTNQERGTRTPKMIIPDNAHYSLNKIANDLGIGTNNIIRIPSDAHHRMNTDALEETLNTIDNQQYKLFSVVSVFGSTETGAVDDIARVHELVSNYERRTGDTVWKHLDAAHGGPAILTSRYEHLKPVFATYDSITFDPHKQLHTPYNAGSLTIRNAESLRTVSTDAPYIGNGDVNGTSTKEFLNGLHHHLGAVKLVGSQSTQGILSTYLTLKTIGIQGIRESIEDTMTKASYLANLLQHHQPHYGAIEVINPEPDMNLIVWRYLPRGLEHADKDHWGQQPAETQEHINSLNEKLFTHYAKNGPYLMSKTALKPTYAGSTHPLVLQRAAIMSPHTSTQDLERFVKDYLHTINSGKLTE